MNKWLLKNTRIVSEKNLQHSSFIAFEERKTWKSGCTKTKTSSNILYENFWISTAGEHGIAESHSSSSANFQSFNFAFANPTKYRLQSQGAWMFLVKTVHSLIKGGWFFSDQAIIYILLPPYHHLAKMKNISRKLTQRVGTSPFWRNFKSHYICIHNIYTGETRICTYD